jgi:hypothetical protein
MTQWPNVRYDVVSEDSVFGHPAPSKDIGLPRINDAFLDCAAYLYRSADDAEAGKDAGGSGFLLSIPSHDPKHEAEGLTLAACVTNRHVIELGAPVARLNHKDGPGTVIAEFTEAHWVFHPGGADLAITLIPLESMKAKYRRVAYESFLTREVMADKGIGVGDEVFLVGRFINHDGGQENSPTARFGNIAQLPGNPLHGESGAAQESYLIECRSIGGFSGSPVFVQIQPFTWRPDIETIAQSFFGPFLLGVDWCHTFYKEPVMDASGCERRDGSYVDSHSGLMGVVPAWKLTELVESEEFAAMIREPKSVRCWGLDTR